MSEVAQNMGWAVVFSTLGGIIGVVMVMNLNTPSSLWMSPRQSLSSWLDAISDSDIISVFDVPSMKDAIVVVFGVLRLPLTCANGADPTAGGAVSYLALPQLTT